jgi:hypothetical protein
MERPASQRSRAERLGFVDVKLAAMMTLILHCSWPNLKAYEKRGTDLR